MKIGNRKINNKKYAVIWFLSFSALFTVSSMFGIMPESDVLNDSQAVASEAQDVVGNQEKGITLSAPMRIKSDTVGLDTPILNPDDADINTLNSELNKGAVRYPGSGLPGSGSNVFVFGHSSHLPVVNNQAYKAFNGIEKLEVGDEIFVETKEHNFVYKVVSVELLYANEAKIMFDTGKDMLTLSTCNNFGSSEERYVVKAELDRVEDY